MNPSILGTALSLFLCIQNARAFLHVTHQSHHGHGAPPSLTSSRTPTCTDIDNRSSQRRQLGVTLSDNSLSRDNTSSSSLDARPRSKWDDLVDEDDDEDDYETPSSPTANSARENTIDTWRDMTYNEVNIRRQANTYDQLEAIGGEDAINDVYARAPGGREWWLVGKIARISDVTPEQAIERQWPLIERHIWALRLPVRPTSALSTPFEVWYATPGNSELEAARNDPKIEFTRAFNYEIPLNGKEVSNTFVGFVGKVYDERRGEPMFFVERNVVDGSCLKGREMEGDWILRSELEE